MWSKIYSTSLTLDTNKKKIMWQITGITPTFSPCTNIPKLQIKDLFDKEEVGHLKRSEPIWWKQ